MKGSVVVLSALLLAGSAFADDDSSRAKLMGQWQQTDGSGETKSAWTFEGLGRFHTRGQVCWRPNLGGVRVQYAGEGMCGQGCGPQGESVDVVQRAETRGDGDRGIRGCQTEFQHCRRWRRHGHRNHPNRPGRRNRDNAFQARLRGSREAVVSVNWGFRLASMTVLPPPAAADMIWFF